MNRIPVRAARAAIALALIGLLAKPGLCQSSYTVTDLGILGKATAVIPYAVNSANTSNVMVIGRMVDGSDKGFFWSRTGTTASMVALTGINLNNGRTYWTEPVGLNSHGDVAGKSIPSDSTAVNYRAIYWNKNKNNGATLNLDPDITSQGSTTAGINEAGVIVGQANGVAVYWKPDSLGIYTRPIALSPPSSMPGSIAEYTVQINNNGDILGRCADANWLRYAVVWHNMSTSTAAPVYGDPIVLGSDTYPETMNNAGQVVVSTPRGTLYKQALFTPMADGTYSATPVGLRALGGSNNQVWTINDSGLMSGHVEYVVAGVSQLRAAAWTPDGAVTNLGTLAAGTDSRAYGSHFPAASKGHTLNSSGQGIGRSMISGNTGVTHGFRWTLATGIQDLNSSVLTPSKGPFTYLLDAACIADNGYIVGGGMVKSNYEHAYLLTPVGP